MFEEILKELNKASEKEKIIKDFETEKISISKFDLAEAVRKTVNKISPIKSAGDVIENSFVSAVIFENLIEELFEREDK